MSISERATAKIETMKREPTNRDRLREEWRLKAVECAEIESQAEALKETKGVYLEVLAERIIATGPMSYTAAEHKAKISAEYKTHIDGMLEASRNARLARIVRDNADRIYWEQVSNEANDRAEMKMSRG